MTPPVDSEYSDTAIINLKIALITVMCFALVTVQTRRHSVRYHIRINPLTFVCIVNPPEIITIVDDM